MINLGVLPTGRGSEGLAINSAGEVVGAANVFVPFPPGSTPPGEYVGHAFLYSDRKMQDLNDMVPANTGWVLNQATGINDRGEIAGTGTIHGEIHAFLLTLD